MRIPAIAKFYKQIHKLNTIKSMENTSFEQFIKERKNWTKGNSTYSFTWVCNLNMTSFIRELHITHSMKWTYSLNGFEPQKMNSFQIHQLHACQAQVGYCFNDPQGWYGEQWASLWTGECSKSNFGFLVLSICTKTNDG